MNRLILADIDQDTLMPISPARAARRQQIATAMRAYAKASETALPVDERRQVITTDDDRTICMVPGDDPRELAPVRHLPEQCRANALATGGQIEHAAGPSWQHRAAMIALVALAILVAIGAACALGMGIDWCASEFGARFLS